MLETWRELILWIFPRTGTRVDENFRMLESWLPVSVELEDTGAADTVVEVGHRLGRVPRAVMIVNQVTGAGDGPVSWYREDGDGAWTARTVSVRFDVANARVMLWIW